MTIDARNEQTGETVSVSRISRGIMWCPWCGHSQQVGLRRACANCGAIWVGEYNEITMVSSTMEPIKVDITWAEVVDDNSDDLSGLGVQIGEPGAEAVAPEEPQPKPKRTRSIKEPKTKRPNRGKGKLAR
ncbi:hypothetical protein LCGC14_3129070 [marine sediment metagenome]|uniref:Uncharacterized protein n=1 Tax=marine sediment metagenome TaxID=412755 RepID=A0A0F8Y7B3_9ZZZZ